MLKEVVLTAIFGLVTTSPTIGHHDEYTKGLVLHGHTGYDHGGGYSNPHAQYSFAYGVHDHGYGPTFGHSESRDGYSAKGEYFVHLPDGRVQKVYYEADQHGYHPTVSYSGKAHFPPHVKHHDTYH